MLSYEAWVSKTPPSRSDLVESMPVICDLVNAIVKYLPTQETTRKELSEAVSNCSKKAPESSPARKKSKTSNTAVGNGHLTVKMHSLLWFPNYIQRFGIGLGFDTSSGEQHHKESVKYPGNNTSHQKDKFTTQVTLQNSDRDVVREIHGWVHSRDDVITQSMSKQSRNFIKGNYTMEIVTTDDLQEIQCKTLWKDYNKRVDKDSYKLNKFIPHAIVSEAREHGYFGGDSTKNTIVISGYTEAKFAATVATTGASSDDFIIRASPRYRGEERYDWCIVKVPFSERKKDLMDSSNTSLAEVPFHSFAKVLGFIQYRNPDYPTFHSRNGNVKEHYEDNRYYVVLECHDGYVDMDQLGGCMMHHFEMKRNLEKLKIFPIEVIVAPLAVITNFMSSTSTHYIACMDRSRWSKVFTNRIQEKVTQKGN